VLVEFVALQSFLKLILVQLYQLN